jgi:hypothetical protein
MEATAFIKTITLRQEYGSHNPIRDQDTTNHSVTPLLHAWSNYNSVALVQERAIPTERPPLVGEVSANCLRIEGCRMVSATDPHGRILGFLDRSRYFFFQATSQLYSRG